MAELLLRGDQSLGDLRARAARLEPIPDLDTLRPIVDGLLARGLMIELTPPGRGQIVSHNLYLRHELDELKARHAGRRAPAESPEEPGEGSRQALPHGPDASPAPHAGERLTELAADLAALRAEIEQLRERLDALEHGAGSGAT
jgi:uncharacterized protein YceH (UPF0502 family)